MDHTSDFYRGPLHQDALHAQKAVIEMDKAQQMTEDEMTWSVPYATELFTFTTRSSVKSATQGMFFSVDWNAVGAIGQWVGALATAAAVWVSLHIARKQNRPMVKVGANFVMINHFHGVSTSIQFKATNASLIPVKITSFGIDAPGKFSVWLPESRAMGLPRMLNPGESIEFLSDPKNVAIPFLQKEIRGMARLRVFFSDAAGTKYTCKWRFNPSEWMGNSEQRSVENTP